MKAATLCTIDLYDGRSLSMPEFTVVRNEFDEYEVRMILRANGQEWRGQVLLANDGINGICLLDNAQDDRAGLRDWLDAMWPGAAPGHAYQLFMMDCESLCGQAILRGDC